MNNLPTFMIIGAGKSGTTALYEYLAEHPEVYMSKVKETNFFALEGEEKIAPEDDPDQMHNYYQSITSWEAYCDLFKDVQSEKAIGEVSPMYLYSPVAAARIKERLPNTKIIAILRDPVDRLYSRYMHLVRENREPSDSFEDSLNEQSIWWKRNDLVQEGFYHQHLTKFYSLFDPEQIRVYLYDDFRKDPKVIIQDMFEFIGVDASFIPDLKAEFNVSGKIQNQFLDKLIGQNSMIKSVLLKTTPAVGKAVIANNQVRKWVNELRSKNLKKEPLSPQIRQALIDKVYKPEITDLQQLLNVDLSKWLTTK